MNMLNAAHFFHGNSLHSRGEGTTAFPIAETIRVIPYEVFAPGGEGVVVSPFVRPIASSIGPAFDVVIDGTKIRHQRRFTGVESQHEIGNDLSRNTAPNCSLEFIHVRISFETSSDFCSATITASLKRMTVRPDGEGASFRQNGMMSC